MRNWKTSLFGSLAGLVPLVQGIITKDWVKVGEGVSIILTGLFAKDSF